MKFSQTQEIITGLVRTIKLAKSDLLDLFPVQSYIAILDSQRLFGNYGAIPAPVIMYCQEISKHTNEGFVEIYHKLVLLTLIEQFEARLADRRIPKSIVELFYIEFARIIDEIDLSRKGYYLTTHDPFLKDLGLCRLKLYPCGPELVDELSGIPRKVLIRGDLRQIFRGALFFLFKGHGFRPYYELHMHAPLRKNFHPDGWVACYRRVAELLDLNPSVKGVTCISWWFDPQLETISPRLKYLRTIPSENGAQIFYVEPDKTAAYGAVEKSETRKKLYEAGEYIPQLYMMVWPRQELIEWANKLASPEST